MALPLWEYYGPAEMPLPLIREPLRQLHEGCRFASIARMMEYQLRIAYGKAYPRPFHFLDGDLVDQTVMMDWYFKKTSGDGSVTSVLEFAKYYGLPLCTRHWLRIIDYNTSTFATETKDHGIEHAKSPRRRLAILVEWCGKGIVMGTMIIFKDYSRRNDKIYMGVGVEEEKKKESDGTHCVVILGLEEVEGETYFVYQDSRGAEYPGLRGKGRNLASIDVLLKIYKVYLSFPKELCPPR